jgi:anti-sigma28 factor (negative regulator of flagellin synthesis)
MKVNRVESKYYQYYHTDKKEIQKTKKTDKVELIKKQVQNGVYKIDLKKTAKAMAKQLLLG